MKVLIITLSISLFFVACNKKLSTHQPEKVVDPVTNEVPQKEYKYETVENDPLNSRIYTLDNGLKVYLSVYKGAPRIQTYIAVGTGSANDPSDATGLAHYLEHMLFKGTKKFGTQDYEKEKVYLDEIEALYEKHRAETDPSKRKAIYAQIDSVSNLASGISIANEYDKMLASIGATGTNAYTWVDQTVYVNDIPANQMENWLTIEADRFQNPVLRIFHTELEAVYEEKNRSLDSDYDQVWEQLLGGLFPDHTYGTQTTIGTIDHLKNPSIVKIKEYLNKYYIPNNIAICLSGDLDPDQTIAMIDEQFGSWDKQEMPIINRELSKDLVNITEKEVRGPEAEGLILGYKFDGAGTKDADMVKMIDMILSNSMAGLLDLNLNKAQKVLSSSSFVLNFKEHTAHILEASPKEGQDLSEVRALILEQIDNLKKGNFDEHLLKSIINDFKYSNMKELEYNSARADRYVTSFIHQVPLDFYVEEIDRLSKITKEEVVAFVNENYKDNYVVVSKKQGDREIQKVEKPAITPVQVNRDAQSPFLKSIIENTPLPISPSFVDFKRDIEFDTIKSNIPVKYIKNIENETFDYFVKWEMGKNNNPYLSMSFNLLKYLGTESYSNEDLQRKFYNLGCSYSIQVKDESCYIQLSGLTENFERALVLLEDMLDDLQGDDEILANLVQDVLKRRQDNLSDRRTILWGALYNYAIYGAESPFTNILSEQKLLALKAEDLVKFIKDLNTYEHSILYYGSMDKKSLVEKLNLHHKVPRGMTKIPKGKDYKRNEIAEPKVYVVDYDMEQAELIFIAKGGKYKPELSTMNRLYNEYFGGGMSGIVFQDMRESKALAYSVFSSFRAPNKSDIPYYNIAYIGTQADKLPEAMEGMYSLLTNMPQEEQNLAMAKTAIEQKIRTNRTQKDRLLFTYEATMKLGIDYDVNEIIFNNISNVSMTDLVAFQEQNIKSETYNIVVIGDKEKLNLEVLSSYGKVEFVELSTIFGY